MNSFVNSLYYSKVFRWGIRMISGHIFGGMVNIL
jgi:hypothetical protein